MVNMDEVFDVPSGWRGKEPWFKVGDIVYPKGEFSIRIPYTVTKITERGFEYTHERLNLYPGAWTESGETYEPSSYEFNQEGQSK